MTNGVKMQQITRADKTKLSVKDNVIQIELGKDVNDDNAAHLFEVIDELIQDENFHISCSPSEIVLSTGSKKWEVR